MVQLTDIEQLVRELLEKIRDNSKTGSIPTAELYRELYDRGAELGYRPYGSKLTEVDPTLPSGYTTLAGGRSEKTRDHNRSKR